VAEVLKTVYADKIDVRYYLEHAHIDDHHGRMMLKDVVLRAIDLYGVTIIPEIVTGMEWSLYVQELCDSDFLAQITWMEMKARYKSAGMHIKDKIMTDMTITRQKFLDGVACTLFWYTPTNCEHSICSLTTSWDLTLANLLN
jgi:hypothetical protein